MTKTTRTIAKVITLSLLTASALHATNGDNLIAVGAKARGMGGTGIAVSHGAESTLSNPAMISTIEGTEISFGGTLFMPDINTQFNSPQMAGPGFEQDNIRSAANRNMIPEVSIAHKINDNWYIGAGMFGTAGMGTDYRNAATPMLGNFGPYGPGGAIVPTTATYGNFNMVTNLQLLQFAVPVAYKTGGLTIAASAILQYGNLDINYNMPNPNFYDPRNRPGTQAPTVAIGAGLAQDFGMGWNAGVSYDFTENGVDGLVLGAMYKSKIKMTYDGQISNATGPFPIQLTDSLDQPSEYGLGVSYNMSQHTIAFDWKNVQWSDAAGYADFGWEDQDVFAIGYQFAQDNWALRLGYNYGASTVVEQTEVGDGVASSQNFFNLLGFPATAERHYTIGGTYDITEAFGIDLAYVYSPTVTKTFNTPAFANTFAIESVTTTHQEDSLSFQLTYKF